MYLCVFKLLNKIFLFYFCSYRNYYCNVIRNMPVTKKQIANAVIKQIENSNKKISVETRLFDTYKNPEKVIWKSNKEGYFPDIKAITPEGNANIYEIELSDGYNEDKWRLFSLFAKSKNGELVLVIPESRLEKVKSKLESSNLNNIDLIYIPV